MTYHDETSPAYEETRAEVWFISAAHAEAAGFRPPRRTRL
jgi:methylphosphotriester-DNA--protein-cysteine methyltransferase